MPTAVELIDSVTTFQPIRGPLQATTGLLDGNKHLLAYIR